MSGNKGHSNSSNNIVFVSYDAESFGSKEHGPITSHHVACTKCRAEKTRCSGEPGGCSRCKSSLLKCVYERPTRSDRVQRQQRRSSDRIVHSSIQNQEGSKNNKVIQEARPDYTLSDQVDWDSSFIDYGPEGSQKTLVTPPNSALDCDCDHAHLSSTFFESHNADSMISNFFNANFPIDCSSNLEDVLQPAAVTGFDSARGSEGVVSPPHNPHDPKALQSVTKDLDRLQQHHRNIGSCGTDINSSFPPYLIPGCDDNQTSQNQVVSLSPHLLASHSSHQPYPSSSSSKQQQQQQQQQWPRRHPSSLFPPSGEPSATDHPCKCLHEVSTLISELEQHRSAAVSGTASFDYLLASLRAALSLLRGLLCCPTCRARSEFLVLLSVVCEKATTLCEVMLSLQRPPADAFRPPTSKADPLSTGLSPTHRQQGIPDQQDTADKHAPLARQDEGRGRSGMLAPYSTNEEAAKAFLGHYEVNTPEDWQLLMDVLLTSQLCQLRALIQNVGTLMAPLPSLAVLLAPLETRLKRVAQEARTDDVKRRRSEHKQGKERREASN